VISSEPIISVGLIERAREIRGTFNGPFELPSSITVSGPFRMRSESGRVVLYDSGGVEVHRSDELRCRPLDCATFTLSDVTIGINFHWERKENQIFEGDLRIRSNDDGSLIVINEVRLERYLQSVISSEMNAEAPIELLKAHAITSRSWLVAMLERQEQFRRGATQSPPLHVAADEVVRWYDREDHRTFDVCADDHCQRYQGVTKIFSKTVTEAIEVTRGVFLVSGNAICDARYSKACGGRTELFENCWEEKPHPYLQSVSDSTEEAPPLVNEEDAERWIGSSPDVYCNTTDGNIVRQILPSFDRETTDFFRWKVEYSREQMEEILTAKSGIDFGAVQDIVPIKRGTSGRIVKLKITGTKRTMIVGKELEIRRWLSKTHLYSSAFSVNIQRDPEGLPKNFVFLGAGWGHGVGLCQIGAAVMATKGYTAEEILKHYFLRADIRKLYEG